MTVLSDVLVIAPTVLGSAVIGAGITAFSQAAATRRAERQADRDQARVLFTQIATAAAVIDTEKALFRERRDSWRANATALGQALLQLAAARHDGNWLHGAAMSVGDLREWDSAEGARFVDRLQAAAARANPALVSLSLLSPQFEVPCSKVADALAYAAAARRRADRLEARDGLSKTLAELRATVYEFTVPRDPRAHRRLRLRRTIHPTAVRPGPACRVSAWSRYSGRGTIGRMDSRADETDLGEDRRPQIEVARDELANIYRLRGEIVSRINEFEAYTDNAVAAYFGIAPKNPVSGRFRTWVLARTSFSAKLEIIGEIARQIGIEAQAKPVLRQIRWANDIRNRVAHSHMSLDITPDQSEVTWEALLRHRTVRYSRGGMSALLVTADELQRERDSIATLEVHLVFLVLAITAHSDQHPASRHLEESYNLNPETLETRPR